MTEHNHEHDHTHEHGDVEEVDTITLIDEEGNEVLYEIIMRIDGEEAFGKQYVLVTEAGVGEDDEIEAEVYAYSFTENEDGTEGELQPVESDEEWDMIESTFETVFAEDEEAEEE